MTPLTGIAEAPSLDVVAARWFRSPSIVTDPAEMLRIIRRRNWQAVHRASDTETADHCPHDPGPEYD